MEVILNKDVQGIGKAGSVVKVKDGFALNYLIPQGLAMTCTLANRKQLELENRRKLEHLQKLKQEALLLKEKLQGLSLTIPVLSHDEDKLYANVSAQDIARVLKDEGHDVDKNAVALDEPLKALGIYEVEIKLHPEVTAKIKIWIVKK
jgi:large subunit ribosomal protein L9